VWRLSQNGLAMPVRWCSGVPEKTEDTRVLDR
jgi:hypothetical protein